MIAKKQRDFEHTYHDEEDDDRYFNSRQLAKLRATRYNEKVRRVGDRAACRGPDGEVFWPLRVLTA